MKTPKVLLTATFLILSGCGNFFESKVNSPAGSLAGLGSDVDFVVIKTKVLEPHCTRCHISYRDYSVARHEIQAIVRAVDLNRMPKNSPALDGSLKELLRVWMLNGTPEQAHSGPQMPEPDRGLKPSWDSLYVNIFAPRCTVCHSPTGEAPWVDLSSRSAMSRTLLKHLNFKDPAASYLISRLKDPAEPMPPLPPDSSFAQLTEKEVDVVLEWIRAGLP